MADLPYFQFYPADYLRDTEILSLSAQGGWMRMLCSMWHPSRRGVLGLRLQAVARLLGANEQTARSIIDEIEDCGIADVRWEEDRVIITCRRMVRDWEALTREKEHQVEAGRRGAAKRWGNREANAPPDRPPDRDPDSPPIGHPIGDPISPPIGNPNAKTEGRSQKAEEGGTRGRAAPDPPPPLSPAKMLPVDRVKAELAAVFPDAPKRMTAAEQHELFGSLGVLDELGPEDWQACRGWVICPDRVRGRKLWPRDRAEFVANAGQAVESIRQWWRTGGRSWWNRQQQAPPPAKAYGSDPEPDPADIATIDDFRKLFGKTA